MSENAFGTVKRRAKKPTGARLHQAHSMQGAIQNYADKALSRYSAGLNNSPLLPEHVQPPSFLKAARAQQFCEMRDRVIMLGAATMFDAYAVTMMCLQYLEFLKVFDIIEVEGHTVEVVNHRGEVTIKPHPLLGERARLFNMTTRMFSEFGFMPGKRPNAKRGLIDESENPSAEEQEWDGLLN